jgi:RNA-directed DNA polymerase
MYPVLRHFNKTLVAWAMRKFNLLRRHKTRASLLFERIAEKQPHLFVHWQHGMAGALA